MDSSMYIMVVVVAGLVLWRRTRSMRRPIRGRGLRLLLPLLFLLPTLPLIANPAVQAPIWELAAALAVGCLLSVPLIWTTQYEVREDGNIYAVQNKGFIIALVGILLIRLGLRNYFSELDQQTLGALFLMVALGYVIPWRVTSYAKFRRIYKQKQQ
ncbi:hypothetical protein D3C73_1268660 [compost metagenome]